MTARVILTGLQARQGIAEALAGAFLALVMLLNSSAAHAQVGALVSIYNDDRFRGISLSDGRPVGILDISYDAADGLYASGSGRMVATREEGLQVLGFSLNGGYATRLNSSLTGDLGVIHSQYSSYSGLAGGRSYTEVYAGVSGKLIGGRISISPDYLGVSRWTVYAEMNAHYDLSRGTLLEGEVGVLTALSARYGRSGRPHPDARIGIAQRLGWLTLHADVTTRSGDYVYAGRGHSRTALAVGISTAL